MMKQALEALPCLSGKGEKDTGKSTYLCERDRPSSEGGFCRREKIEKRKNGQRWLHQPTSKGRLRGRDLVYKGVRSIFRTLTKMQGERLVHKGTFI